MVYNLHRSLLCERCPYFKGCFDGPFKETEDKKTALKEENPDDFDEVLRWMYRGIVSRPQYGEIDDMSLINAYILADRLCMEELKNSIVTTLYHFYTGNYITTTGGITTLAEKGLADCELRSFLLWRLSRDIVESGYQQMLQKIPDLKEYIAAGGDEVVHLFETTVARTVDELEVLEVDGEDQCRWHEHLMTPVCPGAKMYGDVRSKKPGTKELGAT